MAYYTALITAWNGATQPPVGVTGTAITGGMTTAQKLAAVNGWTVATPQKALLIPSAILNACVFADLAALTALQLQQFSALISGAAVDASVGTNVRAGIQAIFAGKATTLANLGALVAPFDNAITNWCFANGYPSFGEHGPGNLSQPDCTNAGLT